MIDKILLEQIKSNLNEAIRVILANKVRTFLTALGIIFGVAAVINIGINILLIPIIGIMAAAI